jgi:hypothetical protein
MSHNTTERAVTSPIVVRRVHNPVLSYIDATEDQVASNKRKFLKPPSNACTIKSKLVIITKIIRKVA